LQRPILHCGNSAVVFLSQQQADCPVGQLSVARDLANVARYILPDAANDYIVAFHLDLGSRDRSLTYDQVHGMASVGQSAGRRQMLVFRCRRYDDSIVSDVKVRNTTSLPIGRKR
jgi:hypothetical protein